MPTAALAFDPVRFNRTRWMVFALLVLSYIGVFFHRMAPGVVASDLMQAFATSGAALGSLAAMYYYVYTAMQIPAGVLADTLGPRLAVTIGALVAGAGSIVFGLAPDFDIAAAGRLLVGLGVSVVFVGLMKSNSVWFAERSYGLVSGLTLLLGNLGSILAAGPLAALLGLFDWRQVFITAGIVSVSLAVLTWLLVRNRPEDAGFPSIREQQGLPPHPPRQHHWLRELRTVISHRPVWPGFWVMFGITGTLFAFAGLWGVPLMRDVHALSRAEASLYTTSTLVGFAVAALLAGWWSDRLGKRKPVIIASALLSAACWLALLHLPWGPGVSGLLLYGALGFAAGGFVVGYAAAKEVLPPGVSGMAIALVNTGLFLGAAIMQPAFGWMLDLTWDGTLVDGVRIYGWGDYRNGLWLSFGFTVLAVIAGLRIPETHCQNIAAGRAKR
jgi:sugar phosphate permease